MNKDSQPVLTSPNQIITDVYCVLLVTPHQQFSDQLKTSANNLKSHRMLQGFHNFVVNVFRGQFIHTLYKTKLSLLLRKSNFHTINKHLRKTLEPTKRYTYRGTETGRRRYTDIYCTFYTSAPALSPSSLLWGRTAESVCVCWGGGGGLALS